MIPYEIRKQLEQGKCLVGVTGSVACGKSYACEMLAKEAAFDRVLLETISIDEIRRNILGTDASYETVRKALSGVFGSRVMNDDGSVNRKELGEIIFYDSNAMEYFRDITNPAISSAIESAIESKRGLVLVEWAMLAEDGLLPVVNYNVLLVKCSPEEQLRRLNAISDLPKGQIMRRLQIQLSNKEKEAMITGAQQRENKGKLFLIDTTNNHSWQDYKNLLETMVMELK